MIVEEQRIVTERRHGDADLCQIVQVLQHRNLNYTMRDTLTVTSGVLILVRFNIEVLVTPCHTPYATADHEKCSQPS